MCDSMKAADLLSNKEALLVYKVENQVMFSFN